jgi:amino acid transporter
MPCFCRVIYPSGLDGLHGPFRLGKFSWITNVLSLAFIVLMSIFFIIPTVHPISALNMNYAVVAIGGLVVLVTVQWFVSGRKHYHGVIHTFVPTEATEVILEGRMNVDKKDTY